MLAVVIHLAAVALKGKEAKDTRRDAISNYQIESDTSVTLHTQTRFFTPLCNKRIPLSTILLSSSILISICDVHVFMMQKVEKMVLEVSSSAAVVVCCFICC